MLPIQCRMARAALEWTADDLGTAAAVHPRTVRRFEQNGVGKPSTIAQLRKALVAGGVAFAANDDVVSVSIRPPANEVLEAGQGASSSAGYRSAASEDWRNRPGSGAPRALLPHPHRNDVRCLECS